jgi:3-mercaptopyruvate sulfurtransferase SseA
VQATDRYAGVRGARLVLVDDPNLVRATMAAHWLTQMHWDVHVLAGGLPTEGLESGKQPVKPLGVPTDIEAMAADAAKAKLDAGWVAVDVATSRDYRKGHIPGAWWATRARLDTAAANLPDAPGYLATSEDGLVARYAVAELATLTGKPTAALDGGTGAWSNAGLELEQGETNLADEADDVWLKPYERKGVVEDFMKEYLTWEIDLIKQVERDDLVSFRAF